MFIYFGYKLPSVSGLSIISTFLIKNLSFNLYSQLLVFTTLTLCLFVLDLHNTNRPSNKNTFLSVTLRPEPSLANVSSVE